MRLGFRQIKGLSKERMEQFVRRRGGGYAFGARRLAALRARCRARSSGLPQADAFRSHRPRPARRLVGGARARRGKSAAERLPLFDQPEIRLPDNEPETKLPAMPLGEHVIHDYRSLGLSLKAHPVSFLRQRLDRAGVTPNARLVTIADGKRVSVAGLVLVRQRPGKGNAIFLTLEDEEAIANVIVWQRNFERFRPIVMGSKLIRVTGRLQSESGVIHIVAEKMEDLTPWLAALLEENASDQNRHGEGNGRRGLGDEAGQGGGSPHEPAVRRNAPVRPDIETLMRKAGSVMPKGRNFQ